MEQQTANLKTTGAILDMEKGIKERSPEVAGLKVIDEKTGQTTYVSPEDFMAKLGGAKMDKALFETKAADYLQRSAFSKNQIDAVNAQIALASQASSLEEALTKGKQALANLALTEAQKKSVETNIDNLKNSQSIQQLEIQYRKDNFNNNPIMQQVFHTLMLAGIAMIP